MVFSSVIFLFLFLPFVLVTYYLLPHRARNFHLFLTSLLFYAWGETVYVLIMLVSITINYFIGRGLGGGPILTRRYLLVAGVTVNLLPLIYFKYSGFFLANLANLIPLPEALGQLNPHLPLGISFYTFQAISYLIDVYRGAIAPQTSLLRLGLFISLFPQLIAGPIVRYKDIFFQLQRREVSLNGFCSGIERFIIGLGKKVLLANPLGQMADAVYSLPTTEISTFAAWLGAVSYMLQIYFDFSGYSDMAIGLGRMFGFTFLENFNFPYISRSIQEFWRRWHISLSNWFRDYLYIPLGGNRGLAWRTSLNLICVFAVCGFWHGANWTFLVWGLYHGFFLIVERGRFGTFLSRLPPLLSLIYALLVVLVGWVFFRVDSLGGAWEIFLAMIGCAEKAGLHYKIFTQLTPHLFCVFFVAILACTPVFSAIGLAPGLSDNKRTESASWCLGLLRNFALVLILVLSGASLSTGAYNPFIYFRF